MWRRGIAEKQNSIGYSESLYFRADEIIGERTAEEQKYDHEVVRLVRRGKSISKAISKANQKYPTEALQVNNDNLADVEAHYEYLAEHEAIMEKLDVLKK